MITASRLAGFFAAHAIWTLSESDTFSPMLAYTKDDEKKMERLLGDDAAKVVLHGKQRLEENKMDADDAILVFDGRIPLGDTKSDAVIIEMRAFFAPHAEAVIAIPYTAADPGPFRVHKPKLLVWKDCDDFDMDYAIEQFFEGVDEHDEGSVVWTQHLDPSK